MRNRHTGIVSCTSLDARVKIILTFAVIIAIVAVPYSVMVYTVGAIFFLFFLLLWAVSRLPLSVYIKRLSVIVPLWGIIILFQIFLKNKYYTEYHILYTLPFSISIYAESVEFAMILAVKFLISISFIILLSSTTKMQDLLQGASRSWPSGRNRACTGNDDPIPLCVWIYFPQGQ